MVKLLLSSILGCLLIGSSYGQINDGLPGDSTFIHFNSSLSRYYIQDTASTPLWQFGRTHKTFFTTDTSGVVAIMTDTLHNYPINANNSFIVKIPHQHSTIVDFWHRYHTDSTHAGGLVEFSLDTGITWQNVKGSCNVDSPLAGLGICTANFYSAADTLSNGQPAFTGTKASQQLSRFQFWEGGAAKTTTSSCTFYADTIYVRFRFISDTTVDTLAGWMIDSIKIEADLYCCGGIADAGNLHTLTVSPNPSENGSFTFPSLTGQADYTLQVYSILGQRMRSITYTNVVLLKDCPPGTYFYKATNGRQYYSGRLVIK